MQKIALHSVPRSGSSWLGNILNSNPKVKFNFQPLFSYAYKSFLDENSSEKKINEFFKELRDSDDPFITQKESSNKNIVSQLKKDANLSHVIYKEVRYHHIIENLLRKDNDLKVIGLIRNPMATINSWSRAPKEFKPELGWKIEEEWRCAPKKNQNKREEFNGYEKWKEVAQLFIRFKKDFPDRFYLIEYQDLLNNTYDEIQNLFKFCNLELTEQTLNFIELSTNSNDLDPYSIYKKKDKDDNWKKNLPKFIIDEIKNDKEFQQLNKIFKWI